MFDSGISASSLISGLKDEIDVAIPISNKSYVESLNSLEQLLYTEIIKEQKSADVTVTGDVDLSQISVASEEKAISFEDIYAVFALANSYGKKDVMLKKSTLITGAILPNCWYKKNNRLKCNIKDIGHYHTEAIPSDDSLFTFTPINNGTEYAVSQGNGSISGNIVIPYEHKGRPVTEISDNAFRKCNDISSITIPNTVKRIGNSAFEYATSSSSVYIPESVNSMKPATLNWYFDDVHEETVYLSAVCKSGSYAESYCENHDPAISYSINDGEARIYYFVRPILKTVNENDEIAVGTGTEYNVKLPVEFIDLAKAKLRADAYKIANEDSLAAKWMNDYNVLLETFTEWIERKRPHFGM